MGRPVEAVRFQPEGRATQPPVTGPATAIRSNNPEQESERMIPALRGTQGQKARMVAFDRYNRETKGGVPVNFGGTYDGGAGFRVPKGTVGLSPEGIARKNGLYPPPIPTLSKRDQLIQHALDAFRARAPLLQEYPIGEPIKTNEAHVDTALHEVDHGLAIYYMGGIVTSMTVIPGPGYLGLTEFAGLGPEQTQIAAMASSVLHGKGTGGDIALATYFARTGGMAIESAQAAAQSILHRVPDEMRTQIAKMVAAEGTVGGSKFADIVERAALESALLGQIPPDELQEFIARSEEHRNKAQVVESSTQPRTQFIDVSPTEMVIQVITVDNKCPSCGQPIAGVHFCTRKEAKPRNEGIVKHPSRRGFTTNPLILND